MIFHITCPIMLWVFTAFSQLWLGFEIIAWWIPRKFDIVQILFLSMPFGFLISSLIVFCFSPILGTNLFHMILHTIALCLFSTFMFTQRNKKKYLKIKIPAFQDFVVIFISLFFSTFLISKFYFPEPRTLNFAISNELANEISLINSFLKGSNSGFSSIITIHHPMCYQCRARSQWITAYHSAILILSGCPSLRLSIMVPSIITLTSFCGIFIFVVQTAINMTNSKLTKSNSKPLIIPFISLFMILNLSGMGFFQWFFAENRRGNAIDYVYTLGKDKTTNWLHPILHYILSYRSSPFILYISASILFLLMNEERCLKKKQTLSDEISKNNEENNKQHFHEFDNSEDNIDFEKSKAKPVDNNSNNNQYCENRYQIKQVQKQNEYSLIGTFIALSVPLQHQGFFSIGLYVIFYIIIDFIFTEISKARNGIKFNFSQISTYNINLSKVKTFLKRYGSLLKTDFIDTFFSPAIQKMIIFFFIASSISLIQYRKTGMDVEWIHHELMWSENIKQGYFYPSIVQWYSNLGLFPFYALIIIWFLLDPIHIKFLLPSIPIFIIGNYFNFQTIPKDNFLFFYPTWALVSCIFIPISLNKLSNMKFNSNKKDENEEIQGVLLAFSILFVLSCTLSSIMGLRHQWKKKSTIWSISEENVADYIIHNTNKNDVFLTSESIFDPCSLLAGRTSFKTSSFNLYSNNKVWFYYNSDVERLRENPNLEILPMISFYLEHSRKDFETHLKKDNMNESWSLCFRYESYNLYNRTLHEK